LKVEFVHCILLRSIYDLSRK